MLSLAHHVTLNPENGNSQMLMPLFSYLNFFPASTSIKFQFQKFKQTGWCHVFWRLKRLEPYEWDLHWTKKSENEEGVISDVNPFRVTVHLELAFMTITIWA